MLERVERGLRIACWLLALVVDYQLIHVAGGTNPLAHVKIPELPTLSAEASATPTPGMPGQAKPAPRPGTNILSTTNALAHTGAATRTNGVAPAQAPPTASTISVAAASTNALPKSGLVVAGAAGSNASPGTAKMSPSLPPGAMPPGVDPAMATAMAMGPGMNPMMAMGPGGGRGGSPLPAAAKARVDKIIESELLAPVIRPMPMGLLGIAGEYVFLRAPNGQTGLVKKGDELGGVKLVRIGTNRVLVEQDGQQKELTVFSGYGSETLSPNEKDK